jgi:hypothetical protein
VLPQASVATHVRVAVNVLPQAALVMVLKMEMLFVPQLSVAVGTSKLQALPASTVLFAAQVMTGVVVSTTVTVCEH